jgi:hypothetical protein
LYPGSPEPKLCYRYMTNQRKICVGELAHNLHWLP